MSPPWNRCTVLCSSCLPPLIVLIDALRRWTHAVARAASSALENLGKVKNRWRWGVEDVESVEGVEDVESVEIVKIVKSLESVASVESVDGVEGAVSVEGVECV